MAADAPGRDVTSPHVLAALAHDALLNLLLQLEAPELILLLHVELLLPHVTSIGASVAGRQGLLPVLTRDQCAALLFLQSLLLYLLLLKQLLFSLWSRRLAILFLRWQQRVERSGLQGVGRG